MTRMTDATTARRLLCTLATFLGCLPGDLVPAAITPVTAMPPAARQVSGVVYDDANRNGHPDAGERGIAGVVVTDLHDVVVTGAEGAYRIEVAPEAAVISVSLPDGWLPQGRSWRLLDGTANGAVGVPASAIDFGMVRRAASGSFTFLHASDTHLSQASLPRIGLLRALVATQKPDFVIITGDLVHDALRVGEKEARGYYEMLVAELAKFTMPVFVVPGNHDIFGIERASSLVGRDHPMYGRALCRSYVGPEYFSFTWGGIHFVGLQTADVADTEYYGHLDATQLDWVRRDLARVPAATPVVVFSHIPFVSAAERLYGYSDDPPAATLVRIDSRLQYRHIVSNLPEFLDTLGGHRLEIALGGHIHKSERMLFDTSAGRVRFHQAAAVVGPTDGQGLRFVSGATLYRARDGRIDDGTFLPLDAAPAKP